MWSGLVRAGLQIRRRGDRELVSPVNALPGSEEELWMAVPAFLLAMQRPPVLWFVTEITVSPGNPSDFTSTVCQSCPVSEKPNV